MATKTASIYNIADELDRLCPSQVGDGAGHKGHEHGDDWPSVGWFCDGGNVGNSVFAIHPDDMQAAYDRLSGMPDGALDAGGLTESLSGLRIEWHV
jgi:hypothetical protein